MAQGPTVAVKSAKALGEWLDVVHRVIDEWGDGTAGEMQTAIRIATIPDAAVGTGMISRKDLNEIRLLRAAGASEVDESVIGIIQSLDQIIMALSGFGPRVAGRGNVVMKPEDEADATDEEVEAAIEDARPANRDDDEDEDGDGEEDEDMGVEAPERDNTKVDVEVEVEKPETADEETADEGGEDAETQTEEAGG